MNIIKTIIISYKHVDRLKIIILVLCLCSSSPALWFSPRNRKIQKYHHLSGNTQVTSHARTQYMFVSVCVSVSFLCMYLCLYVALGMCVCVCVSGVESLYVSVSNGPRCISRCDCCLSVSLVLQGVSPDVATVFLFVSLVYPGA